MIIHLSCGFLRLPTFFITFRFFTHPFNHLFFRLTPIILFCLLLFSSSLPPFHNVPWKSYSYLYDWRLKQQKSHLWILFPLVTFYLYFTNWRCGHLLTFPLTSFSGEVLLRLFLFFSSNQWSFVSPSVVFLKVEIVINDIYIWLKTYNL